MYYYDDKNNIDGYSLISSEMCECSLMPYIQKVEEAADGEEVKEREPLPKKKVRISDDESNLIDQTYPEEMEDDSGMCPFPNQ